MKSLLRSVKRLHHRSTVECKSASMPGVTFTIRRISLGRRIELARAIRELAQRLEFRAAGDTPDDQLEAAIVSAEIDQVYLRWGLLALSGLAIDGETATAENLFASGPENLLREIAGRIKGECGLTDDERKN